MTAPVAVVEPRHLDRAQRAIEVEAGQLDTVETLRYRVAQALARAEVQARIARDEAIEEYELLRDAVIEQLNPRDGDEGEVALLIESIESVAVYVESIPCTCPPGAAEYEVESCRRCQALGRRANVRIDR